MFNFFKKNKKDKKNIPNWKLSDNLKAISPEGEKISKPISPFVRGKLRHALELLAYIMENGKNEDQHILTLVSTVDKQKAIEDNSHGIVSMDASYIRATNESLSEMLFSASMKDSTFGKSIITVAEAIKFHKKEYRDFDKLLNKEKNQILKKQNKEDDIDNLKTFKGEKSNVDFKQFSENLRGVNLNDVSGKTDKEMDDMIDDILKDSGFDDLDDD